MPLPWPLPARTRPLALGGWPLVAVLFLLTVTPVWFGGSTVELRLGGLLVALANGVVGVRLLLLAARRHFRPGALGPCYSAGLFGIGLVAGASAGAAMVIETVLGRPAQAVVGFGVVALGVATCAYLPGMLTLPGAAHTVVARLRRGFDGFSVGACLLFAAWVLVIAPRGAVHSLGFWVALTTCTMLSVGVVVGLRAARTRAGALACAGGAALSVVGLGGLNLTLADGGKPDWLVAGLLALLAAAPLVAWRGVERTDQPEDIAPDATTETFAGYPVLAIPVITALTVAVHHLLTRGQFDHASIALGLVAIASVSARETLGAFDVSRYARRVTEQEAQFRSLVAGSSDVIMVLDHDLVVRWQSPVAARQLGLSDQEVVGRHFQSMIHPEDAVGVADRLDRVRTAPEVGGDLPSLIEARFRDGFGAWRETESSVSDQRDVPAVGGLVVHIRDISERKDLERSLQRLARADQLTGLANRRQLTASIAALRCTGRTRGALLLVELEGFTAVNDVRGHDTGDVVLVEVARRLRMSVGPTDLAARLSGDEFAVVTDASPVQAYALATRLLTVLAEPIVVPRPGGASAAVTVHLSASVGLTDLAGAADDEVLRRADLALRRAKQLGRGKVEWYDEALEQDMLRRMTLEQELPDALLRGELDLIYQPILDLVDQRPLAVEALLRWRHPRLGTLLPCDVLPLAENLGLLGQIGDWVLQQATRQLASWLREGRDLSMAINVAPSQLAGPELITDLSSALKLHSLPAERLILELGESGLSAQTEVVDERLAQVRALGVRTALDEFGTGVDSLNHLRRLPIDMVKIGRSFFDESAHRYGAGGPIIDVMVGLGRRLGIDVVAQGLEAATHLDVVRAAGCRLGQGHFFARPQPAEHTEAYLDGFRARAG